MKPLPSACERARVWSSMRMDGELSELEEAFLARHLGRCAACREFAAGVRDATLALRGAPLGRLDYPISAPLRRAGWARGLRSASALRVAAVLVAGIGLAGVLAAQSSDRLTPGEPAPQVRISDIRDSEQVRLLRVVQLGGTPRPRFRLGNHGAVLDSSY